MKRIIGIAIATLIVTSSAANASAWRTVVGEDIFSDGKQATLLARMSHVHGIFARCEGGELSFAVIERSDWINALADAPVSIIYKVDGQPPVRVPGARFYPHNDTFVGVGTDDRRAVIAALRNLKSAKKTVSAGFEAPIGGKNVRASGSVSASGSSAAISEFARACGIDIK